MSAIDALFSQLKSSRQTALMPFITAGDPNLGFTEKLLVALDRSGCQLVEVGIPYSDPIADGPVIQASYTRALEGGVKLDAIFEMLGRATRQMTMPVVTMVSYAIIYRIGVEKYLDRAIAAGVAGAIVPDLPIEEAERLATACRERDFSLIQLVTPTTPRERALKIVPQTTGFVYYVSVTGITGERTELPADLTDRLTWLRSETELPVCVGFGISQPEHVKRLQPFVDGLIVGSAIVRRIERGATGQGSEQSVIDDIVQFVVSMQPEAA